MGVSAAVFESAGKRTEHYVPGSYSRQHNVSSPGRISAGNLCILGEAQGGKPLELLEFGALSEAKLVLGSGSLLEAVAYAFNGSREYVPQKVFALRVNGGTQASLTMKSGNIDLLKVKSWDYGSHTNQLKMWVKNGSKTGSKVITTVYKDESSTTDDIIQPSINIVYTGTGSNPTVTIGVDSISLNHVVNAQTETIEILFEEYSTLATLVARINDTTLFNATVVDSNSQAASANLDTVTNADVSSQVTFFSNFAAFVAALKVNEYVDSIEILDNSTRLMPNTTNVYTYFTGGTTSSAKVADYISALEVIETEDIQIIATPSSDSSVQVLIANHCVQMGSTVNRKERTCFLGGAVDESEDDAISKAIAFNSELVSYVTDNARCTNPLTGNTETVSGAMLAVMLAGMESGMAVNEPLTNKTLNVLGFTKHRTITSMEKLIKKGVLVCNYDPEDVTRFVCIRAMTTYQQSDLIYNERSMVREALLMNRELRSQFKPTIGNVGTLGINDITAILTGIAKQWASKGYIVPSDSNENVWNVVVRIDGDKIYLTYSRCLAAPINFVFITATNHVYTNTIEL